MSYIIPGKRKMIQNFQEVVLAACLIMMTTHYKFHFQPLSCAADVSTSTLKLCPVHVNATILSPFHTYYSLLNSVVTLLWLRDCEDKAVNPSNHLFFNSYLQNIVEVFTQKHRVSF